MFFLLIIALVAAGIFTHAVVWYILAGVLAGFWFLAAMVALVGAGAAINKINKDLDKGFDSDFFKKNRSSRYRR